MTVWTEWALTSSALILAVVLLRAAVGKRAGAGLRYGLWALVLLRLLIPVQLISVPVRETAAEPARPGLQGEALTPPNAASGGAAGAAGQARPVETGPSAPATGAPSGVPADTEADAPAAPSRPERAAPELTAVLGWLWLGGAMAFGLALLAFNLRFARDVRRRRRALEGCDCPAPVYTLTGLPSPCLFGVFRPAVYVDPETAADPVRLRHVLAHEGTHYRHGDHVWSLLRCAALAAHWWNPLVWLAVALSRRDGELFCDEGAIRRLGDGERRAYGQTLLALVTSRPVPADLMSCATTMSSGKKALRERIRQVAAPTGRRIWAVVLALALALTAAACSFARTVEEPGDTGASDATEPEGPTGPTDATGPTDQSEPPEPSGPDQAAFTYPMVPNGPVDPTVLPEREPERVISLGSLSPYAPPRVENAGSFEGTAAESLEAGGYTVALLRDGEEYAAAVLTGGEPRVFMTGLDEGDTLTPFQDIFGCDGVCVSYFGSATALDMCRIHDYFRLTDSGEAVLMLRALEGSRLEDLDGDGVGEVIDGRGGIFFLRDGVLYRADVAALMDDGETSWSYWTCRRGDGRCLLIDGSPRFEDMGEYTFTRAVYFDGESLLVYREEDKPWHDHLVDGSAEGIPAQVLDAAKSYVTETILAQNPDGTYSRAGWEDEALFDDWRVERVWLDWHEQRAGGWEVEIYFFNYELHTTTPERIGLAGAMYMTEYDWVSPGYSGCDMMVFKNDGGTRTLLWYDMLNDMSVEDPYFQGYLNGRLEALES